MAADYKRWQLIAMGAAFAVLIGIYIGLPLGDVGGLQTEPPMLAAGYASFIKSVIFCIQGLATLLPWLLDITASRTRFCIERIWWLWICTWAAENGFTVTHYVMQSKYPGEMPVAGFSVALLSLLAGYVFMSLAVRRLVLVEATRAQQAIDDPSIPDWQLALVDILYITPSAIYVGWLCLASCSSAIQLATAIGVSYENRTTASIVLLIIVSMTTVTQPWILRPQIIFRSFLLRKIFRSKVHTTEARDPHQQETEKGKRLMQSAHWGSFSLALAYYTYSIIWAIPYATKEERPPALQGTWELLPLPLQLFAVIGVVGRHYLFRHFPAAATDGLQNANDPNGSNVVVCVQDDTGVKHYITS